MIDRLSSRFQLKYFSNIGDANLARRPHILRLLDENSLGITEQGPFEKQKRTVFCHRLELCFKGFPTSILRSGDNQE
jgi:hypothetical protein